MPQLIVKFLRMKVLRLTLTAAIIASLVSCGGGEKKKQETAAAPAQQAQTTTAKPAETTTEADANFMENKGIGPVKSVTLGANIDQAMAEKGEEIFKANCTACHKPKKKFIGPAPKGILERRSPEWVMNMIMNPEEMIMKDPIAKKLLEEANGAPMANQNMSEEQARAILEYFRTL